ncbi:selenium-dependent molybdenum cofactor biosynthesis protein YqeB [Desulfotomaculum sp. 1211_IL3151]|uniref:selenium-dependent molybdenum cofactor biosynthesis protein YqeB n=1 Tax=Desulfotomaculum sp. 1211_IL3151 TaxID=3084055 RepID=UPI002FD9F783
MDNIVLVKGAGDLATGVAYRLYKCGMSVVLTEIPRPTVVRRSVSFAEAVFEGSHTVEGVTAKLVQNWQEAQALLKHQQIPLLIDPNAQDALKLKPAVLVDSIMAKRNTGTQITDAPIVLGLGPGFVAGVDVHAVVETNRGHYLGRLLRKGTAEPNTGVPGPVNGYTNERLLRAPVEGTFVSCIDINSTVQAGDILGYVSSQPVIAEINGILRGLIKDGIFVHKGMKIGDIDPRCENRHCYTISDKALAIAGGVLEGILYFKNNSVAKE